MSANLHASASKSDTRRCAAFFAALLAVCACSSLAPRAATISLRKLTGNPRQSNREKLVIRPRSESVPTAKLDHGTFAIAGLPPGSIYLYVFEQAR